MEIKIMSEIGAIKYSKSCTNSTALISITCPCDEDVAFAKNENIKAIFRMKFNDLDVGESTISELPPATIENFDGLKEFLDNLPDIDVLVIHCGAGISRSSAVAAAIDEYFGIGYDVWSRKEYFPNLHVYKLACRELGIGKTQEDYDELFGIRSKNSMFSDNDLIELYEDNK